MKKKKGKKPKKPTVAKLKRKLDGVFSQYIRLRDEKNGCYTCWVKKPWKELQNGHYESRSHNATRFDERNCHAQCVGCNIFKQGDKPTYALRLVSQYGPNVLKELSVLRRSIKQFTTIELQALIDKYAPKQ